MPWIDYKKLTIWSLHKLNTTLSHNDKIPNQVIQFIEETMQILRVELTKGGKSFAKVKIQRGIFQGDTLSPLLFVIAMIPFNHILRKYTAR